MKNKINLEASVNYDGAYWKLIEEADGLYLISTDGRVWSIDSRCFLKPQTNKDGYKYIKVACGFKRKNLSIHRLVAKAFIPNPDNLPAVNHIDEDKTNNNVDNLEWVSWKENINYGTHNQRSGQARGRKVCADGLKFETIKDCAAYLRLEYGTVRNYLSGNNSIPKRLTYLNLHYA